MAFKITKKPAKATVTNELKEKGQTVGETQTQEEVKSPVESGNGAAGPWCEVGFEASYTHNLGNYQSTRVGIHLMIPCLHPEVEEVYEYAKGWVEERLQKVVDELNDE